MSTSILWRSPHILKVTKTDSLRCFLGLGRTSNSVPLEVHDLALTKLERNIDRDRDDVEYLAKTGQLDPVVLKQRYHEEFRPNLVAHEIRCDTNLQVWLDSYWPG